MFEWKWGDDVLYPYIVIKETTETALKVKKPFKKPFTYSKLATTPVNRFALEVSRDKPFNNNRTLFVRTTLTPKLPNKTIVSDAKLYDKPIISAPKLSDRDKMLLTRTTPTPRPGDKPVVSATKLLGTLVAVTPVSQGPKDKNTTDSSPVRGQKRYRSIVQLSSSSAKSIPAIKKSRTEPCQPYQKNKIPH